MDENYMALFLQTGNPVFYTAAKNEQPLNDKTEEQAPPGTEG